MWDLLSKVGSVLAISLPLGGICVTVYRFFVRLEKKLDRAIGAQTLFFKSQSEFFNSMEIFFDKLAK